MNQPKTVAQNDRLASVRMGLAGSSGDMVLVEYTGKKQGSFQIKGQSTGQSYRFGDNADDRQKYVFRADAEYILTLPEFRMVGRESTGPVLEEDYRAAPQVATLVSKPLAKAAPAPRGEGLGTVAKAVADDLTAIRGISKARAKALDSIGITTFEDILAMPADDLLGALKAAGVRGLTIATVDSWRQLAGELVG